MTFKRDRAGSLAETDGGGTIFIYEDAWHHEIGCALPIGTREHRWPAGVHPFFQHLAPEGWLRGRQARTGHVENQDDFGLLIRFGADCIGAVGILPADGPVLNASTQAPVEEAAIAVSRTVSGVQRKLLVHREGNSFVPATTLADPATHIAKFNDRDVPTLVQNEDLTLRIAREVLGEGEVTKGGIAAVRGLEGVALIVERFDRNGDRQFRLEDFAQILLRPRGADFRGKYDGSYEEAANVVRRFSARPQLDLVRFYRLVLFSIIVGNADAHLKNFSLLERPEGLRLSPAYDLLNTAVYDRFDALTALTIDGEVRPLDTASSDLLRALGWNVGLKGRAIEHVFRELARGFSRSVTLADLERAPPEDFRSRYAAVVRGNQERILR